MERDTLLYIIAILLLIWFLFIGTICSFKSLRKDIDKLKIADKVIYKNQNKLADMVYRWKNSALSELFEIKRTNKSHMDKIRKNTNSIFITSNLNRDIINNTINQVIEDTKKDIGDIEIKMINYVNDEVANSNTQNNSKSNDDYILLLSPILQINELLESAFGDYGQTKTIDDAINRDMLMNE